MARGVFGFGAFFPALKCIFPTRTVVVSRLIVHAPPHVHDLQTHTTLAAEAA